MQSCRRRLTSSLGLFATMALAPAWSHAAPSETPSAPPAAAASPEPSTVVEGASPEPSTVVEGAVPPEYGLGIREVTVDRDNGEHFRLSPRSWEEQVHADPRLRLLDRRARAFEPGIAMLSIGGLWLSISTAVAIDRALEASREEDHGFREPHRTTATGALFQWVVPGAVTLAGAVMLNAAIRSRRRLRQEQQRFYAGPAVGRGGAGLTLGGRF